MKATIAFFVVLNLLGLNTSIRKHFFVTEQMTWIDAQTYCRKYHSDLSTVTKEEAQLLSSNTDATYSFSWIGLYEDPDRADEWIWSGGQVEEVDNWDTDQPDDSSENCISLKQFTSKLHDTLCSDMLSFYCMDAVESVLVSQNKAWDEALDYCRQHYIDLVSLSSEMIEAEVINVTGKSQTDFVWTGLRFMAGHWFWVSGEDLQYKAWSVEGEPKCPAGNLRCGALDRNKKVWKAIDCEKRLNFVCIRKPEK
uniref:Novel immune-type receptor 3,-related 1-like n=1 Tax=Danio rerio TaxID=7955 RepID=Q5VTP6_DANRE|nr:C-type mannose receptor 2 [Danio rerio]CAH68844.1 novel protein similar to lectins [Danio rerio]|eukprot:XP_021333404.1 C-type mannose receptor 2 [Danio rerio]